MRMMVCMRVIWNVCVNKYVKSQQVVRVLELLVPGPDIVCGACSELLEDSFPLDFLHEIPPKPRALFTNLHNQGLHAISHQQFYYFFPLLPLHQLFEPAQNPPLDDFYQGEEVQVGDQFGEDGEKGGGVGGGYGGEEGEEGEGLGLREVGEEEWVEGGDGVGVGGEGGFQGGEQGEGEESRGEGGVFGQQDSGEVREVSGVVGFAGLVFCTPRLDLFVPHLHGVLHHFVFPHLRLGKLHQPRDLLQRFNQVSPGPRFPDEPDIFQHELLDFLGVLLY